MVSCYVEGVDDVDLENHVPTPPDTSASAECQTKGPGGRNRLDFSQYEFNFLSTGFSEKSTSSNRNPDLFHATSSTTTAARGAAITTEISKCSKARRRLFFMN